MGSRRLIVMRHAKSSWTSDAPTDFERPLAKRGRKDAPRMGEWLRDFGWTPGHIVSSPAKRARQTAARAAEAMGLDSEDVRTDERIYDAGLGSIMEVLSECPDDASCAMIVGHNPGLEMLVLFLSGDEFPWEEEVKIFPTAAVACLEMPEDWTRLSRGDGTLAKIIRPKQL